MKILIYSDVHFSQDSSIVRSMGDKYSTRLEYLINSLNWAEELAVKQECACVINLGDMFDKPTLNAMEITALKDIKWSSLDHWVLVGNHDSNINSLEYSSSEVLASLPNFRIISKPETLHLNDSLLHFIPYVTEKDRTRFSEYIDRTKDKGLEIKSHIVLSHNDIKGIQLGKYVSQEGFDVEEINKNCNLFLNGHLHNSTWVNQKILNVGNLCGMNFSEDAFKYSHCAHVLDIDTLTVTSYENPYALNFSKVEINDQHPFLHEYIKKPNNVFMIRCERKHLDNLKISLTDNHNVVAYKVIVFDEELGKNETHQDIKLEKLDYLKTFNDFILDSLGNNDIIKDELNRICK